MIHLCCTKKLSHDLHIQTEEPSPGQTDQALLGDWYAHVIRIVRHKGMLFVNERTLFSFIVFDFKEARLGGLNSLFVEHLEKTLHAEGINGESLQVVTDEVARIKYAKATNRSVLGSMNDLARFYKYHIAEKEDFSSSLLSSIIRKINRTPQKNLGWKYSVEVLFEILEQTRTALV